jgi:hypothetical protein
LTLLLLTTWWWLAAALEVAGKALVAVAVLVDLELALLFL